MQRTARVVRTRMLARAWPVLPLLALAIGASACASCSDPPPPGADAAAPAASIAAASSGPAVVVPAANVRAPVREGGAIVRAAEDDALYVVDEDHAAIRVVSLPVRADAPAVSIAMPGPPAQVSSLAGRVLVTIRDPGLLLIMRRDAAAGLVEEGRVALPADAWGVAVTADEKTAIVTSAWTSKVSAVNLEKMEHHWTVDVAREPRGVVIREGSAYVTHLVGSALTRLDDLATATPTVTRVALPASPLRTPSGTGLHASLGYAAVMADDASRLFVARHAVGAMGRTAWFGAATVDVLLVPGDEPLAPLHRGGMPVRKSELAAQMLTSGSEVNLPMTDLAPFTQPRAIVYRKRTKTLLVAGEGDDAVVELDALAIDPSIAVVRTHHVGREYGEHIPVASRCGAPQGIALSADESTAWVFCRSTYDLAQIALDAPPGERPLITRLADDTLDANAALGRRIFYNATDDVTSGGLACAGCHPEGRDDGHVWREVTFVTADGPHANFVGVAENIPDEAHRKGFARRTPMLAGRVAAPGPYGWHAESEDIVARIKASFGLHRWGALPRHGDENLTARALMLVPFLRQGLVPPPRPTRDLDAVEQRGKAIFLSEEARCAKCHVPENGLTDRMAYPIAGSPQRAGYDDESKAMWKTPSLSYVAGRAPYFHDGSAASLEKLVEANNDRMGRTNHLLVDDRAALVAYLRTL